MRCMGTGVVDSTQQFVSRCFDLLRLFLPKCLWLFTSLNRTKLGFCLTKGMLFLKLKKKKKSLLHNACNKSAVHESGTIRRTGHTLIPLQTPLLKRSLQTPGASYYPREEFLILCLPFFHSLCSIHSILMPHSQKGQFAYRFNLLCNELEHVSIFRVVLFLVCHQ